eukprot:gene814-9064_t
MVKENSVEEFQLFPFGQSVAILLSSKRKGELTNFNNIEDHQNPEYIAYVSFQKKLQEVSDVNLEALVTNLSENFVLKNGKEKFSYQIFQLLIERLPNIHKIIQKILNSDEKKKKLNFCSIFLKLLQKKEQEGEKLILLDILTDLFNVIKKDSKIIHERREPTLLTTFASDCFLFLTLQNCENDDFLFKNLHIFVNYFREIQILYQLHRPMFVEATKILTKYFIEVNDISYRFHERDLGSEAKKEILQGISGILKNYIPYFLEQEKHFFIKKKEVNDFFNSLFAQIQKLSGNEHENSIENEKKLLHLLLIVCLTIEKIGNKIGDQLIYETVSTTIQSKDEEVQTLSTYLLRKVLKSSIDSNRMGEIVENLFNLLDTKDSASKATTVLLADYIIQNPMIGLSMLFKRIDNKEKRRNGLNVLAEVFKMKNKIKENRELNKMISNELLHRIHDEELSMRTKATELFKNLDPNFIIPKIVSLEGNRDEKVRSAAHASLLDIFNSKLDDENPFIILINTLNMDQPMSPDDIDIVNKNEEKKLELSQQILNFIPEWGQKISKITQEKILKFTIKKIFSNPSDALLIHVMTRISSIKGIESHSELIFKKIFEQTKIIDSNNAFEFISPLLILKTLPLGCFRYESVEQKKVFQYCFEMQKESINEIKKLSAEIVSRFPVEMGFELSFNTFSEKIKSKDYDEAKVYLFSLCNMVLISNSHLELFQQSSDYIFNIFNIPCESISIQKVQLGCIDYIAAIVMKDLNQPLLLKVLDLLNSNQSDSLSVLMCHIITSTTRLLSKSEIIKFSEKVMKTLIKTALEYSNQVKCSSLQALLHLSFQLKSSIFPYSATLFMVIISSLKSFDSNVKLTGLKLLSSLLVSRDDILNDHMKQFEEIHKLLISLSMIDENVEVRKLAENLVSLFQEKT